VACKKGETYLQNKGHQFTVPIYSYLEAVTGTKYINRKKFIKLQNPVLVWNVTDWNYLLSLDIVTNRFKYGDCGSIN
jgi:hypothetical protein